MMRVVLALWLGGLLALPAAGQESVVEAGDLYALVQQRLDIMQAVAAYKYRRDLAVEAPEREQQILDNVTAQAAELGLDGASVAALFRQQMAAARTIQQAYILTWESGNEAPPEEIELDALRERISWINARQMSTLKTYLEDQKIQQNQWSEFRLSVGHRYVDSATLASLFAALKNVRLSGPEPSR